MAIDSTIYAADIPAGAYTTGDIIPMACIDGPANVRSGRSAAILKSIFIGMSANSSPCVFRVHVKNSDWIDEVVTLATGTTNQTAIYSPDSGATQNGHDSILTPNSSWDIYAECISGGTTTAATSVFALLDIDYPSVSSIQVPAAVQGIPVSITMDAVVPVTADGAMIGSTWTATSVDYLKAGYKYVLDKFEIVCSTQCVGFIAFSNAAGMGGLQRIIPFNGNTAGIRYPVKYSSPLVKGPMEVKFKLFGTAGSAGIWSVHDYVKKAIA